MRYAVSLERAAVKALHQVPRRDQVRVVEKIEALAIDPRPDGSKKLHATDEVWRVRVGPYRVLYRISDPELVVVVIRVAHRREAYR